LQKVAQSLGYVTTAVYRYFPSKDALVAALQRRAIGVVREHFERELLRRIAPLGEAAAPTRALASLLAAADIYLDLPRAEPRAWYLVAVLLGDPRPLLSDEESARTRPAVAAFLGGVTLLFDAAQRAGALDPGSGEDRVLVYWGALHGALCLEKARRIAPELPASGAIGASAARALLSGWGASPARLSAAMRALEKGNCPLVQTLTGVK
jgi:AcrR family transcriptional regulator